METEQNNLLPSSKKPTSSQGWVSKALVTVLKGGIQGYRHLISPLFPPVCRFYPSCSAYALEAVTKHGPWEGTVLAVKRIGRCHPGYPGGYDPVP